MPALREEIQFWIEQKRQQVEKAAERPSSAAEAVEEVQGDATPPSDEESRLRIVEAVEDALSIDVLPLAESLPLADSEPNLADDGNEADDAMDTTSAPPSQDSPESGS